MVDQIVQMLFSAIIARLTTISELLLAKCSMTESGVKLVRMGSNEYLKRIQFTYVLVSLLACGAIYSAYFYLSSKIEAEDYRVLVVTAIVTVIGALLTGSAFRRSLHGYPSISCRMTSVLREGIFFTINYIVLFIFIFYDETYRITGKFIPTMSYLNQVPMMCLYFIYFFGIYPMYIKPHVKHSKAVSVLEKEVRSTVKDGSLYILTIIFIIIMICLYGTGVYYFLSDRVITSLSIWILLVILEAQFLLGANDTNDVCKIYVRDKNSKFVFDRNTSCKWFANESISGETGVEIVLKDKAKPIPVNLYEGDLCFVEDDNVITLHGRKKPYTFYDKDKIEYIRFKNEFGTKVRIKYIEGKWLAEPVVANKV